MSTLICRSLYGASHPIDLPVGLCKAVAEHRRFCGYILIIASLYGKVLGRLGLLAGLRRGRKATCPKSPGCQGYAGNTGYPGSPCFRRPLLC